VTKRVTILAAWALLVGTGAGCNFGASSDRRGPTEEQVDQALAVNEAIVRCMRTTGAEIQYDDVAVGAGAIFSWDEERIASWSIEPGKREVYLEWGNLRPAEKAAYDRCLDGGAPGYAREIYLATFASGDAEAAAEYEGRLAGDEATGCLWLVASDSDGREHRSSVVWRDGYTAYTDPLRLYFRGKLVARVGDAIRLGGGNNVPGSEGSNAVRTDLDECFVSAEVWSAGSPVSE
jgi:hypothetical protein